MAGGGKMGWRLTFVDFGMVGRVPANLRAGLREMTVGMGTRDAGKMVRAFQTIGMLLPDADVKGIERMSGQIFDLFWGKSMTELREIGPEEMHRYAARFRGVMYDMPFQLPNNLLMLGRTVAILSGMCTGLDPEFNLWNQLAPYATKLLSEEGGSTWTVLLDTLGEMVKDLAALPSRAGRALDRIDRGELNVQSPQLANRIGRLEKSVDRLGGSVIFAAFFLGGVLLLDAGRIPWGGGLLAGSLAVFIWILLSGRNVPGE
jgi:predicted unusual protein kinase regulating ubiquinone biosynthesis (AarF/ABC1/UbiB family)